MLTMTYRVVVLSIGIQGMTLGRRVGKIYPDDPGPADRAARETNDCSHKNSQTSFVRIV